MKRQAQILGLLLGLSILAAAQETRGSLSGIVTDGSGAVVARAGLQLTNTETGVVMTTVSNDAGLYRFLFLNPGQYKLVASMAGFKTFERDRIQLNVSEAGTLPVVLEVGAQSERITVSAEAPLIEAEKADHGMVIDNKKVVDIPINTRNPIMLAAHVQRDYSDGRFDSGSKAVLQQRGRSVVDQRRRGELCGVLIGRSAE